MYIKFDLTDWKERRVYIETLTSLESKKGDDSREADVLLRGGIDLIDERKRNRNPRNPVIETVRGLLPLPPCPSGRAQFDKCCPSADTSDNICERIRQKSKGRARDSRSSVIRFHLRPFIPFVRRSNVLTLVPHTHSSRPVLPSPHSPRANFLPLPAPVPPSLVLELCFSYFSPHAKPRRGEGTISFVPLRRKGNFTKFLTSSFPPSVSFRSSKERTNISGRKKIGIRRNERFERLD